MNPLHTVTGQNTQNMAGQSTQRKLDGLRRLMAEHGLDAYLVPAADEHINEYLPLEKERRAWLSGFTGSAGDFLAACEESWLFADSRYHEQADKQVDPEHIRVSKLGLEGQPGLIEKIRELAAAKGAGFRLGFDPFTLTVLQYRQFVKAFSEDGVVLVPVAENLVDSLWTEDRPAPVLSAVFGLDDSVTGESAQAKLARAREAMRAQNVQVLPVTKLDQIAWLFNLRGQDIPYNPLFSAYAVITPARACLFVEAARMDAEERARLEAFVDFLPYQGYQDTLKRLADGQRVLIDPRHTTYGTLHLVETHHGLPVEGDTPIELMKAVKNPVEIAHMQAANLKASRGKIRALKWLDDRIQAGETVTEESFRQLIEAFYAEEPDFIGLSFNTISGAGVNSSIVHYSTPDPGKRLQPGELFLIDSGCQFAGGTTDDTRTVIVGEPTELQRQRYTEVLKAHINCARQIFPKGTDGVRLDGITRATLWNAGLDYGHGTGHGVGAFLNVHEGPNGIHKLANKPFQPGMITSVEPGYYQPGWGGIRLENLYLTIEVRSDETGTWYGFESLIYIPFDKRLIDFSLLETGQLAWLKAYYQAILDKLAATLEPDTRAWLEETCHL